MSLLTSGSLPSITLGNISLNSPAPTISSTATSSNLTFQTANNTGYVFNTTSAGVPKTSFSISSSGIITTDVDILTNLGQDIALRTTDANANIYTSTAGTNMRFQTGFNTGQFQFQGSVASFDRQILTLPGPDITASVVLALPLRDMYFITSTTNTTVTLPTNSAAYAGTRITFRRIATTASPFTFNQTGGASVFFADNSTIAAPSISFLPPETATEFISNGTYWCQLYAI